MKRDTTKALLAENYEYLASLTDEQIKAIAAAFGMFSNNFLTCIHEVVEAEPKGTRHLALINLMVFALEMARDFGKDHLPTKEKK